jgi:hypothetical protein
MGRIKTLIETARNFNSAGKALIIVMLGVSTYVLGNEVWFRHCSGGRIGSRGSCWTDDEYAVILTGLVLLIAYHVLYGFKKKS